MAIHDPRLETRRSLDGQHSAKLALAPGLELEPEPVQPERSRVPVPFERFDYVAEFVEQYGPAAVLVVAVPVAVAAVAPDAEPSAAIQSNQYMQTRSYDTSTNLCDLGISLHHHILLGWGHPRHWSLHRLCS